MRIRECHGLLFILTSIILMSCEVAPRRYTDGFNRNSGTELHSDREVDGMRDTLNRIHIPYPIDAQKAFVAIGGDLSKIRPMQVVYHTPTHVWMKYQLGKNYVAWVMKEPDDMCRSTILYMEIRDVNSGLPDKYVNSFPAVD